MWWGRQSVNEDEVENRLYERCRYERKHVRAAFIPTDEDVGCGNLRGGCVLQYFRLFFGDASST